MARSVKFLTLAILLIGLTPGVGSAAPLNLFLQTPDVLSGPIDVSYNAGTDAFDASGFALDIDGSNLDAVGSFVLSAVIDDLGVLSSGSLSILGTHTGLGHLSGTLLTGNLTDFGFSGDAAGIIFEFAFDPTGGDLAPWFPGAGGIILTTTLNSFSGFGSNFDNLTFGIPGTGGGVSDTAPTPAPAPEPATWLLLGVGLAGAARRRFARA